ncbi:MULTISPECIES: hypothetical protein [Mycobacteroides]|uniref:hypothetical protein n=1 Tax=Mycobacteroides TaxID=670516 RepID=UPI00092C667A|nr:hypothetical protein [Mycobacteroides abscessus]MBN7483766.1 hypothetical protein [Mycobacteroides abscessus subsp. massiliense]MDO3103039.1 hypothetical protein [Mycobacteroides abscessus subsp. abscessus]RIR76272.1 hypothetical protein D2E65_11345 [Mycobacteroides abscessus]SIN55789.1 Uncharacterised protein [Mycobacteroides abscessus subsp. abscessus]
MSELDPAAVWRALPKALPKALQAELRADPDQTLSDDLLRRFGQIVDDKDLPVFWRADPDSAYTRHRLHAALAEYISTH